MSDVYEHPKKLSPRKEYIVIEKWDGSIVVRSGVSVHTIKYLVTLLKCNRHLYNTSFVSSRWQYTTIRLLCAVVSILNKVILSITSNNQSYQIFHPNKFLLIRPSVLTVASGPKSYISRLRAINSLMNNVFHLTRKISALPSIDVFPFVQKFKRIISCLYHHFRRLHLLHENISHSLPFIQHVPNLDLILTDC